MSILFFLFLDFFFFALKELCVIKKSEMGRQNLLIGQLVFLENCTKMLKNYDVGIYAYDFF